MSWGGQGSIGQILYWRRGRILAKNSQVVLIVEEDPMYLVRFIKKFKKYSPLFEEGEGNLKQDDKPLAEYEVVFTKLCSSLHGPWEQEGPSLRARLKAEYSAYGYPFDILKIFFEGPSLLKGTHGLPAIQKEDLKIKDRDVKRDRNRSQQGGSHKKSRHDVPRHPLPRPPFHGILKRKSMSYVP